MGKKKRSGDKGNKLFLSISYSCMGYGKVINGSIERYSVVFIIVG